MLGPTPNTNILLLALVTALHLPHKAFRLGVGTRVHLDPEVSTELTADLSSMAQVWAGTPTAPLQLALWPVLCTLRCPSSLLCPDTSGIPKVERPRANMALGSIPGTAPRLRGQAYRNSRGSWNGIAPFLMAPTAHTLPHHRCEDQAFPPAQRTTLQPSQKTRGCGGR